MKTKINRKICIALAAVAASAVTLCGCASGNTESEFDQTRPWHDDIKGSYEKLTYAVTVYDETAGTDEDKRVAIADGGMTFVIDEPASIISEYTTLDTEISYTYNSAAPEQDRGLTDTMTSRVRFSTDTLYAIDTTKTVSLATRKGAENLSYTVSADYAGTRVATYRKIDGNGQAVGDEQTMTLPSNARRDNEMMFMLARAQGIAASSSTVFSMVNLYDTFRTGEFTEYRISAVTGSEIVTLNFDEWVAAFGVESAEEDGKTVYPVPCYSTNVGINADKSGPAYNVMFAQNPFVKDGKSHSKIPMRIGYRQYKNGGGYRYTEYLLTECSFTRQ